MNAPTLLRTDTEFSLPGSVIDDIGVSRILDSEIIYTLVHPCGAETIRLRQELFRLLEDGDFRDRFESFGRDIRELSRLCKLYRSTPDGLLRCFVLCELEKSFASVCENTNLLRGCTLTNDLSDYWNDAAHTSLLEKITSAAEDADAILAGISRFDISLQGKSWVTPDYDSVSYAEAVRSCAQALGFDVGKLPRTRVKSIPVDGEVALPLSALRKSELSKLRETLVPYDQLDCASLTRLSYDISFYLGMHDFVEKVRAKGIPICYPTVSETRRYSAKNAYDVTLIAKGTDAIVPNDIEFDESRHFSFLIGANGGGKTTYLRCVGVNLVLFLSGSPVFAEEAEIFPFRHVGTHFPADERMSDFGRLHDEMMRASAMLDGADSDVFLLFNETFSGTNDERGRELALDVAKRMTSNGLFGIFVTHFTDIDADRRYPCLEAVIDGDNGDRRTFRIVPRFHGGGSYASDILKKYGLDTDSLSKRRKEHG